MSRDAKDEKLIADSVAFVRSASQAAEFESIISATQYALGTLNDERCSDKESSLALSVLALAMALKSLHVDLVIFKGMMGVEKIGRQMDLLTLSDKLGFDFATSDFAAFDNEVADDAPKPSKSPRRKAALPRTPKSKPPR